MTMAAITWADSSIGEQFDIQLGKMLDSAQNVGDPKAYLGNRAVQWGEIDVSAAGVVGSSDLLGVWCDRSGCVGN